MSGERVSSYQPPLIGVNTKKPVEVKQDEEFNLLDIDFEDYGGQSNHSSNLDFDPDIKEELPSIPEKGFLDSKAPLSSQKSNPKTSMAEDINANTKGQGLIDKEDRKDDLEENKANIVQQPDGWQKYTTLEYYKQYFEITTEQVIERIIKATVPTYQGSIFDNGNIDLYGPVWVIITLNVAITIFGNMSRFIKFETSSDEKKYKSELNGLTSSITIITLYFILLPVFLSVLIKVTGTKKISKAIFKIMSIYGYSFVTFIPASFLYMIPMTQFKWLVLL